MNDMQEIDEAIDSMRIQYTGRIDRDSVFSPTYNIYLCESPETQLLRELANLCQDYLKESDGNEHWLDSLCMSAGERAFIVLEKYGMLRIAGATLREAYWTDAGRSFLDDA